MEPNPPYTYRTQYLELRGGISGVLKTSIPPSNLMPELDCMVSPILQYRLEVISGSKDSAGLTIYCPV